MDKKFNRCVDYLKQAAIIISQHSLGCSTLEYTELKIIERNIFLVYSTTYRDFFLRKILKKLNNLGKDK